MIPSNLNEKPQDDTAINRGRRPLKAAIRAPWGEAPSLRAAIAGLRQRGETVVCVLPGHESELEEFECDRELVGAGGAWTVKALELLLSGFP